MAFREDTLVGLNTWLAQHTEDIIDADRAIVDPHHHLWHHADKPYLLEQLWADTSSGHNIQKTVFVECGSEYRVTGPDHLKPVGETGFAAAIAKEAAASPDKAQIAGIVAHADLCLGDRLDEVLDAHEEAANGLFRGIRDRAPFDPALETRVSSSRAEPDLFDKPDFRTGLKRLGARGFTFDAWNYHCQIKMLTRAARAAPDTQIIFDHFGGPLGIGPYEGKQRDYFESWQADVAELAACENVVAKLGGMAMPINGWGWHKRATPATSDELVAAHRDYYLHSIDCFGPSRCMLESNFPVDRKSISHPVLWNALKKIVGDFSESEKEMMFRGTAARVYTLA